MKKPKPPNLVTVAILTTITIVFWVFFTVYTVLTTEPKTEIPENLLSPVNPTLDVQTLIQIEDKKYYTESDNINPIFSLPNSTPETDQIDESPIEIEEESVATDEAAISLP